MARGIRALSVPPLPAPCPGFGAAAPRGQSPLLNIKAAAAPALPERCRPRTPETRGLGLPRALVTSWGSVVSPWGDTAAPRRGQSLWPPPCDPAEGGGQHPERWSIGTGSVLYWGIMQPPNITVTEKRGPRGPRGQQGWGGSGPRGRDHRERAVPGVSCTGGRDFPHVPAGWGLWQGRALRGPCLSPCHTGRGGDSLGHLETGAGGP